MNIEPTFRAASVEQVKQELRRVLESSAFKQSPALSRLLQYLCGKAICETPQQVTEYTLAVDVFGKPPNFKDSKDAIVRVEMHRLRKRLAQFYEEAGDTAVVRIVIPPGQYLPEFRVTGPVPALVTEQETIEETIPATVQPARAGARRPFLLVAIGTVSLVATAVVGGFLLANPGRVGNPLSVGPDKREVRILAGLATGSHVDASGRVWQADRYYKGGVARAGPKDLIPRPPDRALFQWLREGAGPEKLLPEKSSSFGYDIPLKRGTYDMRLYFADPLYENPLLKAARTDKIFAVFVSRRMAAHCWNSSMPWPIPATLPSTSGRSRGSLLRRTDFSTWSSFLIHTSRSLTRSNSFPLRAGRRIQFGFPRDCRRTPILRERRGTLTITLFAEE